MAAPTDTSMPSPDPDTPPVHDPSEPVNGVTRHLAAGAYLDSDLRRVALTKVLAHPKRSVAPSAGFDLAFVLTHCLRARRAVILRDALEVGALVLCLHAATVVTLELWSGLALWSAALVTTRILWQLASEWWTRRGHPDDDDIEDSHHQALRTWERWVAVARASRRPRLAVAAVCLATVVLVAALLRATFVDIPPIISAGTTAAVIIPAVTVAVIMVLAVPLGWSMWRQRRVERLTRGHPAAVRSAASKAMRRFEQSVSGNTTGHSTYQPFIGSGTAVHRWAFAVRILPAESRAPALSTPDQVPADRSREFQRPPFASQDLIDHFCEVLGRLDTEELPQQRLPGLKLRSHVYVPSDEVSRPMTRTGPAALHQIIAQPTAPERHYLVLEVVVWNGELVTTVFLHAAVQGMTLYLESTTTALLPCKRAYRIADLVGGAGAPAYVRAMAVGLLECPSTVILAPFRLARECHDLSRAAWNGFLVNKRWFRGYDYGASISIRELAQADVPKNRPQMQDVVKYNRIIERRVLACVIDFFEANGVDTFELNHRAEMVLNVGVVNAGVVNTGSGTVNTTTAAGVMTTSGAAG